jgi:hypothetical protein
LKKKVGSLAGCGGIGMTNACHPLRTAAARSCSSFAHGIEARRGVGGAGLRRYTEWGEGGRFQVRDLPVLGLYSAWFESDDFFRCVVVKNLRSGHVRLG